MDVIEEKKIQLHSSRQCAILIRLSFSYLLKHFTHVLWKASTFLRVAMLYQNTYIHVCVFVNLCVLSIVLDNDTQNDGIKAYKNT